MSDDLLITPGSRKLEIKDSSGNIDAKIETDASGNLLITNAGGDISIGDTSSDVFIGDGTNNVDIVFEQNGEIRGTSGVTLTLGSSGSSVVMGTDLSLGGNDLTNVGDLTVTGNLTITGDINSYNVTDLDVSDKTITLGVGQTEANSGNSGIIISGSNASILWDESNDRWSFNKGISTSGVINVSGTSASSFYAASFTRSSSGLVTPDIWGSSSTLVLGTSSTDERLALSTDGALIYGRALVRNASSDQNTSQDSASIPDTTGPEIMRFEGGYTNGQYTTEFAKVDRSGNLPLYVRQSKGTANSFSNIARFGDHGQANGSDVFAVFGGARVGGRVTADNLTLNSISTQSSEATVLTINGSNVVGKRDLGSNAFNSTAYLPLAGGTMSGNIAMANYNITGVNQLEINDPGEGIVFKQGSSGDMVLKILDDSSDNILQYAGTNAVFDVAGTITTDALTNSGNTTLSGNIRQTIQNVGIPTVYGQYTMEATDAQMDLVSSSDGTWGSAINLVQGASTSANTNVWSIARNTGTGPHLNFNFGTSNQHDNPMKMKLSSGGQLTTTGNIVNDIGNSGNDSYIELKNTGYTGNVTSLRQNADSTRAELNSTERSILIQAGSSSSANSAEFRVYTNTALAQTIDASQNTSFSGQVKATTTADATPAIVAENTGGVDGIIQEWIGDTDKMQMVNVSGGDYFLKNSQQSNGITFFDGTGGVGIYYNNAEVAEFSSLGGMVLHSGALQIPNNLQHKDDSDTYIKFDADRVRIVNGNNTYLDTNNGSAVLHTGSGLNASNLTSGTVPEARLPTQSKYLRSDANDTLSATLKVTGSIIHEHNGSSGYISRPKGAQYQTTTGTVTGAIKIKLPTHGSDDMLSFWVDIYDYTSGESVTLWIGGYLYQTTGNNEWVNETALIFTEQTGKAPENVRFGADGSNNCIWIGETTDTWSYPQVIVRDFFAGYTTDIDAYDDNWAISFVTSFDTVDTTRAAKGPVTEWDRVEGKPTIPTNNNQLTNGAGYITASSLSSYLPLSGGTLTGDITISNTSPALNLVDSNSFSDANDRFVYRAADNRVRWEWYDNSANTTTTVLDLDSTGLLKTNDVRLNAGYTLQRSNHHSGHLEGSYNNVAANADKTNPIYSIGSSYNPNETTLNNFYGIGYSKNTASFMTGALDAGDNNGWGLYVAADGDARIFLNASDGIINSTGEHYVNSQRVFHDGYHPNADKWTTARTLTLTGDATGSGSWDGSGNLTITTTVGDDSHFHHRLDSTDDRDMKPNTSGIAGSVQAIKPFFSSYGGMTGTDNTTYVDVLAFDTYSDSSGGGPSAITFKKGNAAGNPEMHIWHAGWNATTWSTGQRVFADNYHPNADEWTTARTLTLSGDASGSVSIDGSQNVTLSVAVSNDSHTHAFNNLTGKTSGTGEYSTSSYLTAGRGSGGVSLTHNDGYGNANVTFNHKAGVPEQAGNCGRIVVNTDSTTNATMYFELKTNTGTTAVNTPSAMELTESGMYIPNYLYHMGDTDTYLKFDANRIRLYAGGTLKIDTNNTYLTSTGNTTGTAGGLSGTPNITVGTISSGQITATKIHAGGDSTSYTDGTDPDISTDDIFATVKVVSPKIVWLNDASGDDNYVTCNDNNNTYTVKGNQSGAWWEWYGDKTLAHGGHRFDYWKGKGAELTGFIYFTGTGTGTEDGGYIYFGNATTYKINANQQSVFAPGSTTSSDSRKGLKFKHGMGPEPVIWYHATGTGAGMLKIYTSQSGVGDIFALDATDGDGHFKGDVTAFSTTTTSDIKLKENVRDLEGALDTTLKLRGVKFDWKDENKANDQLGFIAQEVEEVLPEIVKEVTSLGDNDETHKSVNYSAVVPILVEAIKELKQEIDDLKEQLKNKEL